VLTTEEFNGGGWDGKSLFRTIHKGTEMIVVDATSNHFVVCEYWDDRGGGSDGHGGMRTVHPRRNQLKFTGRRRR
jgi:hypothetical protein